MKDIIEAMFYENSIRNKEIMKVNEKF
jgi:hypothetical protein